MDIKPTVFIVDDEPAILNSLRVLLQSPNWHIKTFSSAREFLDAYDGRRPACLVLDVRMPEMDGLELQEQLERDEAGLPIIMITGHSDVDVAVKSMKAGAVDFFEKPFDGEALLRSVRGVIKHQEQAGVLTRITKQLMPKEAHELYRAILPRLILGIIGHLDRSANVATVGQIVDEMCRTEILNRLRSDQCVRDRIVEEISAVLNDSGIKQRLSREKLLEIIETSGVMNNLLAMEACLSCVEAA